MNKIQQAQREVAKEVVVEAIDRANGRIVDAAKLLGIRNLLLYPAELRGL